MSDLISRQAAIEHLKKRLYETALNNDTEHPYYEEMADNRVSVWLEEVPSVEPKRGKWLNGNYRQICSVCRYKGYLSWKFCPNCGAKMDEVEE